MRIAVPDNVVFSKLYSSTGNVDEFDVELIKAGEAECSELMLKGKVELALLSPLGYGLGVKTKDYRIIPGPAIAAEGYTGLASIYFGKGLYTLSSCLSPAPDDFMMIAMRMLLAERYNIHINLKYKQGTWKELLSEADSSIVWEGSSYGEMALDVTEEWFDTYWIPMPLAFWVYNNEELEISGQQSEQYFSLVRRLADKDLSSEEARTDRSVEGSGGRRESGRIFWQWSSEIERALDETLKLLFYHQMLPEIPAVKCIQADI